LGALCAASRSWRLGKTATLAPNVVRASEKARKRLRFELDKWDDTRMMHVNKSALPRCAVAIPAKNEAGRISACLAALGSQRDNLGRPIGFKDMLVVVFANNCSDGTAELARLLAVRLPFELRVAEASLPSAFAHAGNARGEAMDIAGAWLADAGACTGVILTTDADSQVSPNWIENNLLAIESGADAALGRIILDRDGDLLPEALHRRGRLESAYQALLTELSALLDPLDHNPWPHHATISGASLAITRQMYLRIGGLPRVPLGEDKALVARLSQHDAKIRFCPNIEVTTSGRVDGRAPGGVADTLRLRSENPNVFCDEALEPFRTAIRRAKWRRRLRRAHYAGISPTAAQWSRAMEISRSQLKRICRGSTFGATWSAIETASPLLIRQLLTPSELPAQILGARRALSRLKGFSLSTSEDIEAERGIAHMAMDVRVLAHGHDEELGSLVAGQRVIGRPGPVDQNDVGAGR
jgi:GT2 family glycosyltransferase